MTGSALYEGWVRHRRFEPVEHEFRYRLFLSTSTSPSCPRRSTPYRCWSARRRAPAWFRALRLHGPIDRPLAEWCASAVAAGRAEPRPAGPVRHADRPALLRPLLQPGELLLLLRRPAESGSRPSSPTSRTSPGESATPTSSCAARRTGPVLGGRPREGAPRLTADGDGPTYDFRATEPGDRLAVHIDSRRRDGEKSFDATSEPPPPRAHTHPRRRPPRPLPGDVAAGRGPHILPRRCG